MTVLIDTPGEERGYHGTVHWAGAWLRVGPRLRQRCAWCGAILIDVDLDHISRPISDVESIAPDDPTCGFPVWGSGSFILHDGPVWRVVPAPPEDTIAPMHFCIGLDPDVTGSTW